MEHCCKNCAHPICPNAGKIDYYCGNYIQAKRQPDELDMLTSELLKIAQKLREVAAKR